MGCWATKIQQANTLPLKRTWVLNCFHQKPSGEKFSATENFAPSQLQPDQCSQDKNKWVLKLFWLKTSAKRNALGNRDCPVCFEKFQKIPFFLGEIWSKIIS